MRQSTSLISVLRLCLSLGGRIILPIYVVSRHVLESEKHRRCAVHAAHEGNLALLRMTDSMRQDAQTRVTSLSQFRIGHCHGSLVMLGHKLDKQCIERRSRRRPQL